ncbi:paraquat-inducible membrane protein A [Thalassotalea litorea]|uniref:Paraquat-inducible membrane protein A n=1 Tax=Thalassotalea litorea TaxID=2020715 RepID=A0A5R9IKY7_9GAMM|nr:paraquat-inducible protein A [Thalassotalea litorea]TLU66190.1 paraquat-inducible membrane protein A [Thalassotalea litorea]
MINLESVDFTQNGKANHFATCDTCHWVNPFNPKIDNLCERCNSKLQQRKPLAFQKTLALTLCSIIAFFPANLYPIMTILQFGKGQGDTILSGTLYMFQNGMIPIAAIVFIASFIFPLAKIIGLIYLLYSVKFPSRISRRHRSHMYRYIEMFGPWSMLDVFVVAILVSLVEIGNVLEVVAGPGATAFGIMVLLSIFAAASFDSKMLWDERGTDER